MRFALAEQATSKTGRSWWAAGLSLSVVLALVLVALAYRGAEREVPTGGVEAPRASPALAASALQDFVAAVTSGDPAATADLAPNGDVRAEELLRGLGENAVSLGITDLTARYVDQVGPVGRDGSWRAAFDLEWRFADFDRSAARSEVVVVLAPDGKRLGITGFGGGAQDGRRTPLWLQSPLAVVRDDRVLVAVDGDAQQAREIAARARRGLTVVARTLPRWREGAVIEVPASAAALDEALGADPGTYAAIAAVTATVDGSGRAGSPTHVFVNPDLMRGLHRGGAQVVVSHEIAHLATGAATSLMDVWLLEGFADFVALRDTTLPDRVTLGRAIALVRRDGVPERLPGPDEFDGAAPALEAAYELAWLACRVVAEQIGPERLVRLYGQVESGMPVTAALQGAGLPQQRLVTLWRARLQDLAG